MSCDALATQKQREQRETALKRVAEIVSSFLHACKTTFCPNPSSVEFGFLELVTALALPESSSDFTPGPAGPGNRMITWYLEPWLLERRCVSHSSIFLELVVCVAEQQRQQPRRKRRAILGSSIQLHVRWRCILWHHSFANRVPSAAQVTGCKIFGFSTVLAMAPQQAAQACGESCHPFELQNP